MKSKFICAFAWALLALAPPLAGKAFDSIPAAVWALKEDPAKGVKGAVILEQKVVFAGYAVEHLIRVRILSEGGRGACEIGNMAPEATDIQGRTSYRDGKFVLFDQRKDFSEKEVSPDGDRVHKLRVLLPPGVTSDCVVEIKWLDMCKRIKHPDWSETYALPASYGWGIQAKLGGAFKTLKAEVDFTPNFTWSYTLLTTPQTPVERQDSGSVKRFIFHDIPAAERPPYSLDSLAPLPSYVIWSRPWGLTATQFVGVQGFWDEVGQEFFKPWFTDQVRSGSTFRTFAEELLVDLPATPQAKATLIQQRLERRIPNLDLPTYEEQARQTHKDLKPTSDLHDLDGIVSRGRADASELQSIYLALLKKAGVHSVLALVEDRAFALFNYDLTDPFQGHYQIFGIAEPGKMMLWVDPALRFARPGTIQPVFQGTIALFLDTDTWKASRGQIPIQEPSQALSNYAYELNLGDEADRFTFQAAYTGWDEWLERRDVMALEPAEQAKVLKERMEKGIPESTVAAAEVLDAQNPEKRMLCKANGSMEHSASAQRTLAPFPGMASPLFFPAAWPDRRTEPILMDHLLTWTAKSRLHVPKGLTVTGLDPARFQNAFGRVIWKATPTAKDQETLVEVEFRVDVNRSQAQAEAYEDLKAFLDSAKKAYHKVLVLERP